MKGDEHKIIFVVGIRLLQFKIAEVFVATHTRHHRLLAYGLDAVTNQVAFNGIQIKGLIRAANGDDMAVQVAVAKCALTHINAFGLLCGQQV